MNFPIKVKVHFGFINLWRSFWFYKTSDDPLVYEYDHMCLYKEDDGKWWLYPHWKYIYFFISETLEEPDLPFGYYGYGIKVTRE